MSEHELIKKLNILMEIKPDEQWKKTSREVLFSQIFNGEDSSEEAKSGFSLRVIRDYFDVYVFGNLSAILARPTLTVSIIMALVLSSGIFGVRASRDTMPGDSLYIAKIISEKTKMAFTFSEKEKAKLEISFASNRTKELSQLTSDESGVQDQEKVDRLTEDFKSEINSTRLRLQKIAQNSTASQDSTTGEQAASGEPDKNASDTVAKTNAEKDSEVFSANMGKDDKGVQISAPKEGATVSKGTTSTTETITESVVADESAKILDEAEKLFDNKDYEGAINKLEEANSAIDQPADSSTAPDFIKANTEATTTE